MKIKRKEPLKLDIPNRVQLYHVDPANPALDTLRNRCNNAVYAAWDGNMTSARNNLLAALDIDSGISDIYYFLAVIADTVEEQQKRLQQTLAIEPNHMKATEAIAMLRGELESQPKGSKRSQQHPLRQNEVEAQEIMCPQCKGRLHYKPTGNEVRCHFCGFVVLDKKGVKQNPVVRGSLASALLKRRNRPTDWNIGKWQLHCNNCGSDTTLSKQTLTNQCRFCDSTRVVNQGVHAHFEQPDVIVSFRISKEAAIAKVKQHVNKGLRGAFNWVMNNDAEEAHLSAVYLPFWVFDAEMNVKFTWAASSVVRNHPYHLKDVLFFAADVPRRRLLENIEPFNLEKSHEYDPRMLAQYPAELYKIDIDQASIDVRTKFVEVTKRRARHGSSAQPPVERDWQGKSKHPGFMKMNVMTRSLTYRFALLPVYVGRTIESDGEERRVIVNGQTGDVAVGKVIGKS